MDIYKIIPKKLLRKRNIDIKSYLKNIKYREYPDFFHTYDDDVVKYKDFFIKYSIILDNNNHEYDELFIIENNNEIYIAVRDTPPIFWYKINDYNDIRNVLDVYYHKTYPHDDDYEYNKMIKIFIGDNDTIDHNSFINYVLLSPFMEKIVPEYKHLSSYEIMNYISELDASDIIFYTKYSKSRIRLNCINDGYFMTIEYNGINFNNINKINDEYNKDYDKDIPVDLLSFIIYFPFITYRSMNNLEKIEDSQMTMFLLLIESDEQMKFIIDCIKNIKNRTKFMNDILSRYEIKQKVKEIMKTDKYAELSKIINELTNDAIGDTMMNDKEYILSLLFDQKI